MRRVRNQKGVTLVELIIVLAISALVVVAAVADINSTKKGAAFRSSLDQVKTQIRGVQNESQQAVSQVSNAPNAGQRELQFFGKMIEFNADETKIGPDKMIVSTLVTDPNDPAQVRLAKCDAQTIGLKNRMEYKGDHPQAIIFTRNPSGTFVGDGYSNVSPVPTINCNATGADAGDGYTAPTDPCLGVFSITLDNPAGTCDGASYASPDPPTVAVPAFVTGDFTVTVSAAPTASTVVLFGPNGQVTLTPDPITHIATHTFNLPASVVTGDRFTFTATQQTDLSSPSPNSAAATAEYYDPATPLPTPTIDSPDDFAHVSGLTIPFELRGLPGATITVRQCSYYTGSSRTCISPLPTSWSATVPASGMVTINVPTTSYGRHDDYYAIQQRGSQISGPSQFRVIFTDAALIGNNGGTGLIGPSSNVGSNGSPGQLLLNWLFPQAHAAVSCDGDVLNPANYTNGCFATAMTLPFEIKDESSRGSVVVDHHNDSIIQKVDTY